jgi:hypothetical protein
MRDSIKIRGGQPIGAPLPDDASVVKNTWWYATCSTHGRTAHIGALGGECGECAKERTKPEEKK